VAVLVVVRESKRYAASESLFERGVEDLSKSAVSRWLRIVDLPDPDSPLEQSQVSINESLCCDKYNSISSLTEIQRLDFLTGDRASTKHDRPYLQPRPWHYQLCRHLVLWWRRYKYSDTPRHARRGSLSDETHGTDWPSAR
jgi:hypothetical protein